MNEKINVLDLNCGLFRDFNSINTLFDFMKADPRINLSDSQRKELKFRIHSDDFTQRLNEHLLPSIVASPVRADDFHQVFNFNIPQLGKITEIRLEVFGLAFGEIPKDPKIVQPVLEALRRPYDVLGLCPFCADDQLSLSSREIRLLAADYNASLAITPERIIELAKRNRQLNNEIRRN